ncbi:MAG: integration host factor subunit beta [Proteobacteria bacterium]|nr:integration host factor subunit beta [Pseudomonadota bacterium]
MIKSELALYLAERADITVAEAMTIVHLFFQAMTDTLVSGERVELRGFGAFFIKEYESYLGRNPKTGEKIFVPPKRLPYWRTGQELRDRVDSAVISLHEFSKHQ